MLSLPPQLSSDVIHKSFSLSNPALLKNIETPGTFSRDLSSLLLMNGLPVLNLSRCVAPHLSTIQSCF